MYIIWELGDGIHKGKINNSYFHFKGVNKGKIYNVKSAQRRRGSFDSHAKSTYYACTG